MHMKKQRDLCRGKTIVTSTKTPEQLAEEFAKGMSQRDISMRGTSHREESCLRIGFLAGLRIGFLAGYQAALDQLADAGKVMNSPEKLDGWISVKDRLPEEGMEVVIGWFQQTASNKLYWTTDVAILRNKAFGGWRNYPEATHWLELPAPPKEEK
jgi:hypothetical protein